MLISIELDQDALDMFDRDLDRMADRALDAEPAMARIADDFLIGERVLFATEGAEFGGWEPDTDAWQQRKSKAGKPTRTLAYTQTLERSLTVRHAKYGLRVTGPGELVIGTLDPVAHLLQHGTGKRFVKTRNGKPLNKPRYAGSITRRLLVEPTPAAEARWSGYMTDWLVNGNEHMDVGL